VKFVSWPVTSMIPETKTRNSHKNPKKSPGPVSPTHLVERHRPIGVALPTAAPVELTSLTASEISRRKKETTRVS
jgi:hypothetical protein